RESIEGIPLVQEGINQIILSGGLVRCALFPKIVSYVFRCPVLLSRYVDTASVGAFLLAAMALGFQKKRGAVSPIVAGEEITPSEATYVQYYEKLYELYRSFVKAVLSFASESRWLCQS
ncbi:MAG: FGGY-family carbohydrate kinase, partial [Candidatus Caldatribacterium sp.]|nr:FGGY-family carbohydrate kinase [Candidatus Caldatribacterium sp.]